MFFFDEPQHVYIRVPTLCCRFWHSDPLKHPQNPYSIESACDKLSKTPSHARIGAVGGSHHHFECSKHALSGPNQTRGNKTGLIRGRVGGESAV